MRCTPRICDIRTKDRETHTHKSLRTYIQIYTQITYTHTIRLKGRTERL